MRKTVVFRYIGLILVLNSIMLFVSAVISIYYNDDALFPLIFTGSMALLFGIFPLIFVPSTDRMGNKEGLAIVIGSWFVICIFGMLPYIMWGGEFSISNAWFESVSGYTTTGATILNDIENVPKGLLFWRAMTHWIGGIGIIIFALAVIPFLPFIGKTLYSNEMSAAASFQFKKRTGEVVKIISTIYLGLTALETVSLIVAGMSLFDAVAHSFATIATGGFSTKNLSIAAYNSISIEIIIMVFMLLSGLNFAFLFTLVIKKFRKITYPEVAKYYILANAAAIIIVTLINYGTVYDSIWESLRYSAFQLLSVGTSTGFANADSSIWATPAQFIIIFFTLQTACAGSTSGGIKIDRVLIFFKSVYRQIKQILMPNVVLPSLEINRNKINADAVSQNLLFILIYVFITFLIASLLTLWGVDGLTAFSGSAACMGNVGPGLSDVGSLDNYSIIPDAGKWLLSIAMLLGRLEIFGPLLFLLPKTWQ